MEFTSHPLFYLLHCINMDVKQPRLVICKAPTPVESSGGYGTQCISHFTEMGTIDYIGYATDDEFIEKVEEFAGGLEKGNVNFWKAWDSLTPATVIEKAVAKAFDALPLTEETVYFFIFPWSADRQFVVDFGGVSAVAPHASVIHLFVDPTYPGMLRSIEETVVHEYTHLYYYQISSHDTYALYEHMLMEGVAEVFREEIVGGRPAPWSTALDKKTAVDIFVQLKKDLNLTDEVLQSHVLFGGGEYPRWAGYSIGYHLVQQERGDSKENWPEFIERLRTERPELCSL